MIKKNMLFVNIVGKLIKRGKVWEKDIFGNGYHHECYLKLQKYFSYLPQSDILGDD